MTGFDKILHFWFSFAIALGSSPILAAGLGIGKEIYDAVSGGVASAGDLLADGLGILLASWASPFF